MVINHSNSSSVYRFYESEEDSYTKRDEYTGITSVLWLSEDEVFLYGAVVKNNKGGIFFMMILNDLINKKVKTVRLTRAKSKTIPFGKKIESNGLEILWEIDLTNTKTIDRIKKINGKLQMS